MKTFDKKDVFSWSNAKEAEQYIGKEGYFTDYCSDNLNDWDKDTLLNINENRKLDEIFESVNYLTGLFIPTDKVKEIEDPKKYRPFETMEEFVKTIGDIGTTITYRTKKEPSQEMRGMFTGFMWDSACRGWILGIGASLYRLENLFELAEYKYKNEWQPFGVLDES